MRTRKISATNNAPVAPLKGGIIRALHFIVLLAFAQTAAAQTPDTVFTKVIEVDQIPRSLYARTPSVALDDDENFTVAWSAESKGRPEIFLRRFDAIGRPLSDIRALSDFVGDSLNIENAEVADIGGGFIWVVWQQKQTREASQVAGMILNQDFKVVRARFLLHEDPDPYSRPRIIVDKNGRVLVAWIVDTLPVAVVARLFNRDGAPLTGLFTITQDSQVFRIGEPLGLAVSSEGMFAVAWHAFEANTDLIYLRLFNDENKFTSDPVVIAQRSVFYPSVAFGSSKEALVQWFTTAVGPTLRAQRYDLNVDPLAPVFDIAKELDAGARPALLLANERGTFNSFWSVTDPRDSTASRIFTAAFLVNEQPIGAARIVARSPQRANFPTELHADILPSGNYVTAFTGNDTSITLPAPRVGAIITKPALSDLHVFDLVITPANPTRADSVIAEFKVRNAGFAPAPSAIALLDLTSNTEARWLAIPALGVEQTRAFRYNFGPLLPRNYTLRVTVDDSQEIFEADEKNNVASLLFKVEEAAQLVVEPLTLDFTTTFGQPSPLAQFFAIKNSGSGALRWTASAQAQWARIIPDTGTVTTATQTVAVSVNHAGLAPGVYQTNLVINSNGGRAAIAITLTIAAPVPSLQFSPSAFAFAATQGGANPPEKYLIIRNAGDGVLTAKLTSDQPWLALKPDTIATPQSDSAQALILLGNLSAGAYTGTITIRTNGGAGTVNVTLIVSPQPPVLEISPRSLSFVATEGTANPPAQQITVRNSGGGTLQWSVLNQETWLAFDPRSGSATTESDMINVTASISQLTPGNYNGVFQVNAEPGGRLEMRVSFTVNARLRLPDLVVLAQSRDLDSCFSADYGFVTEFVVQNLGEAVAGPSLAQLSINNEVRQRQSLPALDVGASHTLRFASESLISGFNQIKCEAGVGAPFQESATSNNLAEYAEWIPRRGDVNADSLINLQDLFRLVDLVLQREVSDTRLRTCWAANVNVDEALDIADVLAFIDVLLNNRGAENLIFGGELDLQLTALNPRQTRLTWSVSSPLRAWQATWKLPQGARALPLQSLQQNGFEIDWKITQNELRLLVWRVNEAASNEEQSRAFTLPLDLNQAELLEAFGANARGEMMRLPAKQSTEELPRAFSLSQAYPNPWRKGVAQKVLWRYQLPEPAIAELRIFNVLGQQVRQLKLGQLLAGRGEINWDGRDLFRAEVAPGIYFVEFVAGKIKQRQRLVVF